VRDQPDDHRAEDPAHNHHQRRDDRKPVAYPRETTTPSRSVDAWRARR
jgi:hypothetical protein